MALIKPVNLSRQAKRAMVLDMGDLGRQAERMVETARVEAERIVSEARVQAQQLIDQADGRGFQQGLERGLSEGRAQGRQEGHDEALRQHAQEIQLLTESWNAALQSWHAQREQMLQEAREDLLQFAILAAQKIVNRAIRADPAIVQSQMAAALALLSRPTAVEISINPEDRALAGQVLESLLANLATCQHATLHDDATISRGGCVVCTAGGRVDATIETQLDRIIEALLPDASAAGDGPAPKAPEPPGPS